MTVSTNWTKMSGTKGVYQDGMCHVEFFWRAGEGILSEVLAALRSTTQLGEATREMARMKQGFTWRSQDRGSLRLNQMETSHIWFSLRYLYRRVQQRGSRLFERRANAPALRTNGQNSQTFLVFLDEILVRENLQQHWIEELITLITSATDTRFVRNLGSLLHHKPPASSERRSYRAQPACPETVMRVETIQENMRFTELAISQDEISPARWRHEFLNELWSQCPPRPTEQQAGRATRLRGREITTVIVDDPIADMESIRTGRFSSQLPQRQSIPREGFDYGELERRVLGQFEPPQHHNARSVVEPVIDTRFAESVRDLGVNANDAADALRYLLQATPEPRSIAGGQLQFDEKKEDAHIEELTQVGRRRIVIDDEGEKK